MKEARQLFFDCAIRALLQTSTEDPDLRLFLAVIDNNITQLKDALDSGADPNVTDTTLMLRHFTKLSSDDCAKKFIECMFSRVFQQSPQNDSQKQQFSNGDLSHEKSVASR